MSDAWDPGQYRRFAGERAQPFHDLLALVPPGGIERAVDLGCGTGELSALAVGRLGIGSLLGIDASPAMLAEAARVADERCRFELGDLATWTAPPAYDLVLANASLHWVPDHAGVLARWVQALRPGGRIAVQVPANADHPSHVASREVAARPEYATAFGGEPPPDPVAVHVLRPEAYAEILHTLGMVDVYVAMRVYLHVLPSTADVVEWTRGTSLTRFQRVLEPEVFARFLADYRARLLELVGERSPYLFTFKRIFAVGRLPS